MATQNKTTNDGGFSETADAAVERIRELNERIIEATRKAGTSYLDNYEKTLQSIADYQDKIAESSQVDWITTIVTAQANFTRELAKAYADAGRELLKK